MNFWNKENSLPNLLNAITDLEGLKEKANILYQRHLYFAR